MGRRGGTGATATRATRALARAGVEFVERGYEHDPRSPSFGLEAAQALGVAPERVFKTIVVAADGRLAIVVVPVGRRVDLKAAAAVLGAKRATLADAPDAERATGFVVGGISPFGQRRALPTVLDSSALDHPTILVSGGRRGLDVELAPGELVRVLGAATAPVSR